jgi:spore coat polysaccharide biosynthesis predicted glycosyltransferase SpsG
MYAICIESSHARGMGHLFRALNLINELKIRGVELIIYVNNNEKAIEIIKERRIDYRVVNLADVQSEWERKLIAKDNIKVWINDRLDTQLTHVRILKKNNIKVISFDDFGSGANSVDLNIVGLNFLGPLKVKGKKRCIGLQYLILDKDISLYRKQRTNIESVLVTMGGSDTHGATINVVRQLKNMNVSATIQLGPSFNHHEDLEKVLDGSFKVISNLPSLIKEFKNHDLAITGGGITAFEAIASGLPILMIANEEFEVPICEAIQNLGLGIYVGKHDKFKITKPHLNMLIEKMSKDGMNLISPFGVVNVVNEILRL